MYIFRPKQLLLTTPLHFGYGATEWSPWALTLGLVEG